MSHMVLAGSKVLPWRVVDIGINAILYLGLSDAFTLYRIIYASLRALSLRCSTRARTEFALTHVVSGTEQPRAHVALAYGPHPLAYGNQGLYSCSLYVSRSFPCLSSLFSRSLLFRLLFLSVYVSVIACESIECLVYFHLIVK